MNISTSPCRTAVFSIKSILDVLGLLLVPFNDPVDFIHDTSLVHSDSAPSDPKRLFSLGEGGAIPGRLPAARPVSTRTAMHYR